MACDIAVIGLGIMGSAALCHLARRGVRVVGFDRFAAGHTRGSSHGATRIIRLSYFEHPSYVPLVRRAYALWRELEAESGTPLLTVTGILEIGRPDSALVRGTLAAARLHGLPHSVLGAAEIMRRHPAFRLPDDCIGVLQPDGGYLEAEAALNAQLALARAAGASIHHERRVLAVEPDGEGVRIMTGDGAISAGCAIVAAGPWLASLLPKLPVRLRVTRQALCWFAPREPALFARETFPVFMIESARGIHYGFPLHADGVKIAKHHHADEAVDPENHDRQVTVQDESLVRDAVAAYLPAADGPLAAATTCLYTMSPDGDFIIDRLPQSPQIIVAAPCSGHGFKFAPAIGEILADLATGGTVAHGISRFRLSRFA